MLSFQGIFFTNDQRRNEDLHQYIDIPQSPQAASKYQVKLVQYVSVAELRIRNTLRNIKIFNLIIIKYHLGR